MTRRGKFLWLLLPFSLLLAGAVLLYSSWGLALVLRLAAATLPGELSIASHQGSLVGPISLRDVRYRNDQVDVVIRQLDLDWHVLALFSGRLEISKLGVDNIAIDLKPARQAQASQQQVKLFIPIAINVQQANVNQLALKTAPAAEPIHISQLQLSAHSRGHTITIRQFAIAAYQAQATLNGTVGLTEALPLKLDIDASYRLDAKHQFRTRGTVSGDLHKLQLSQNLSGPLKATLVATANDLVKNLNWHAQLNIAEFDPHSLVAESPPVNMHGKFTATGDLKNLQVESQLQLDSKRYGLANLHVTAMSNLTFAKYEFKADGDFAGLDLPTARFSLQGEGDHRQIQLSQLHLAALKGEAQGQARVGWQPRLTVDARLVAKQIHTGMLSRQWPGQISGEVSLQTQAAGKNWPVNFKLHQLQGEVRGFPVQADINGSWAIDHLRLDKLQLDVGGTNINAHGTLAQQWDMDVNAHSDNLNSLLPLSKGSFKLSGHLGGTAKAPRVQLQGEASQLAYAKTAVEALTVNLDVGLANQAVMQVDVQAKSVRTRSGHWDTIQLQSTGNNAAHGITLDARNQTASLHATLHGAFVPWHWQGSLEQFKYQRALFGLWQLQQPVEMSLSSKALTLSKLCLVQNNSHLCTQAQWDDKQHQASIDARALPLTLLKPWLPENLQLSGELNIQANLQMKANRALQAQFEMRSPDKSIVIHFVDAKEQIILGASSLTAELNNNGLHAVLHLPLSEGGGLESEASLPGWSPELGIPRTQPLKATLKLDRIPADVITRIVQGAARAEGQLHADFHISGSLGKPQLSGNAGWQDGTILVPQLGIEIRQVSAQLKSTQTNTVGFVIKAKSGNGDVQVEGQTRLAPDQGWPTQATLTSHNLEVINIPEAFILVDSKASVSLQGSAIDINGEVTVPQARLRPESLPEGTVPISSDVVIVHEKQSSEQPIHWRVNSHVRVHLGDEVNFNGFGIRGNLRGDLLLIDEPGKLVLGQGEVGIVNGIYRMRGQDLTIRRGQLVFSNTFIDNPVLDVEAVRTVNTITAGVRLKGTLKQPQLTIFSEPTMSESDALAYLLFGHSMSQSTSMEGQSVSNTASALGFVAGDYLSKEIGGRLGLDELRLDVEQSSQKTSLVMGKYLSPKLYLRYFSGIVESSSIVQLQYQLSRRVQIQTEGGYRGSQSVTGGDIYFTIEY